MSKRHAASRRRTYGRRQHDLHERVDRRTERVHADRAWRGATQMGLDPVPYLDAPPTEPQYGFVD